MRSFAGKVAVITGAASGIGAALAKSLAQQGCHLALADVNETGLQATAEQARSHGVEVSQHVVDVASREAWQAFREEVLAAHGRVELLFNNAGVTVTASFDEMSLEDFEWLININLWGVVYGCKTFLDDLATASEAHIINISSIFGVIGVPGQSSYCASKFAVRGFTEALAEELAHTHIGVTVIHPGGVNTNIINNSRTVDEATNAKLAKWFEKNTLHPDKAAKIILDGVKRNQTRVRVGKDAIWMDRLRRLAPVWSNRWIARGMSKQFKIKLERGLGRD